MNLSYHSKESVSLINSVNKDGFKIVSKILAPKVGLVGVRNPELNISPKTTEEFAMLIKNHYIKWKKDEDSSKITSTKIVSEIKMIENFKRPKLNFNSFSKQEIMAEIDMTRPQEEIIEYIKHIKSTINKDEILSINELIDSSLHLNEDNTTKNPLTKEANNILHKLKVEKLSEMFFAWDYISAKVRNYEKYNKIENRK